MSLFYLLHLLDDLILPLVFGDGADEEAAVVQTHAHADELPLAHLVVVQHLDGSLRCFSGAQKHSFFKLLAQVSLHWTAYLLLPIRKNK